MKKKIVKTFIDISILVSVHTRITQLLSPV